MELEALTIKATVRSRPGIHFYIYEFYSMAKMSTMLTKMAKLVTAAMIEPLSAFTKLPSRSLLQVDMCRVSFVAVTLGKLYTLLGCNYKSTEVILIE